MRNKKEKKEKPRLPPAIEFRLMLGADLCRAEKLLKANPSLINCHSHGSETSLHFWVVENRADIIVWLLKRGADPDVNDGYSGPLFDAAMLGHTEVCQLLINAAANPNQRTEIGETPLHAASMHGHAAICSLLVQVGADVNAADISGETPWDVALPRKQKEIRKLLEGLGATSTDPAEEDCE